MNPTWKAVLGVILIFIFGCVCGALGTTLVVGHKVLSVLKDGPQGVVQLFERRMTRGLNLSPEQKVQVDDYFVENLAKRLEIQKQVQPQVQALNRETMVKIEALLRPEQKERFDANIALFRGRFGNNAFNPATGSEAPTPGTEVGSKSAPAK